MGLSIQHGHSVVVDVALNTQQHPVDRREIEPFDLSMYIYNHACDRLWL